MHCTICTVLPASGFTIHAACIRRHALCSMFHACALCGLPLFAVHGEGMECDAACVSYPCVCLRVCAVSVPPKTNFTPTLQETPDWFLALPEVKHHVTHAQGTGGRASGGQKMGGRDVRRGGGGGGSSSGGRGGVYVLCLFVMKRRSVRVLHLAGIGRRGSVCVCVKIKRSSGWVFLSYRFVGCKNESLTYLSGCLRLADATSFALYARCVGAARSL